MASPRHTGPHAWEKNSCFCEYCVHNWCCTDPETWDAWVERGWKSGPYPGHPESVRTWTRNFVSPYI